MLGENLEVGLLQKKSTIPFPSQLRVGARQTNPEKWWLEDDPFLLGFGTLLNFRGVLFVLGIVPHPPYWVRRNDGGHRAKLSCSIWLQCLDQRGLSGQKDFFSGGVVVVNIDVAIEIL